MEIQVDYDLCASHGQCEFAAPEVFWLDDDAQLHVEEAADTELENVRRAARVCPTRAITVSD